MQNSKSGFSIVEFLMVLAMLMILAGLVGPHFASARNAVNATPASHAVAPARSVR
jgi:type II secretory pathway pseudopilin PulG